MNKYKLALLFLALGVSACSSTKEQLGLTKKSPDEFQVVKRAPLAMPPDYSLRPPEPGAPRPQEQSSYETARETIFGEGAQTQAPVPSNAGESLLQQAGATQADPNIRRTVDSELDISGESNKPVIKRLMNIGDDTPEGVEVDPVKEAERLKKNAEEGKPVTAGETPNKE